MDNILEASHSLTPNGPKIFSNLSVRDGQAIEDALSNLNTKYKSDDDAIKLGMLYVLSIIVLTNGKIVCIP